MKTREFMNKPVAGLYGAPGHHQYFLSDEKTIKTIISFTQYIRTKGMEDFLRREYPLHSTKRIIINEINNKLYVVDGNKHLICLLLVNPNIRLGNLMHYSFGIIRYWNKGFESFQNNGIPYEIFIPHRIDTSAVSGARTGYDYFKNPPEKIRIIPADIPFDSPPFKSDERGKPLWLTASSLSTLIHI